MILNHIEHFSEIYLVTALLVQILLNIKYALLAIIKNTQLEKGGVTQSNKIVVC